MKKIFTVMVLLLSFFVTIAEIYSLEGNWQSNDGIKFRLISSGYDEDTKTVYVGLELKVDDEWYLYSNKKTEFGQSLNIDFESEGLELVKIHWPAADLYKSKVGKRNIKSYIYSGYVLIPAKFNLKKVKNFEGTGEVEVSAKVKYSICKDNYICIPGEVNLGLDLSAKIVDKSLLRLIMDWFNK